MAARASKASLKAQDKSCSTKTYETSVRAIPAARPSACRPPWAEGLSFAGWGRIRPRMMKCSGLVGAVPLPRPPEMLFGARLTVAMAASSLMLEPERLHC